MRLVCYLISKGRCEGRHFMRLYSPLDPWVLSLPSPLIIVAARIKWLRPTVGITECQFCPIWCNRLALDPVYAHSNPYPEIIWSNSACYLYLHVIPCGGVPLYCQKSAEAQRYCKFAEFAFTCGRTPSLPYVLVIYLYEFHSFWLIVLCVHGQGLCSLFIHNLHDTNEIFE